MKLEDNFKVKLNGIYDQILIDIFKDPELLEIPEAIEWLQTVMDNNVLAGKQNRAKAVVNFFQHFRQNETDAKANLEDDTLIYILALGGEIFQACALIADDIMDGSETRRGKLCWYKHQDVGLSAINDSLMLENFAYHMLWRYFSHRTYFQILLRQTNLITFKTILGQCMNTRTSIGEFNLNDCTMDKYLLIIKYKTCFYTFQHPVACAMIMAGFTDDTLFKAAEEVTLLMGELFQVQDDFLDCYGNPTVTGKIGTDIIDGKCTWLLIQALEFASNEQRKLLQISYGSKAEHDENTVKAVYKNLNIEGKFVAYEKKMFQDIQKKIQALPKSLPKRPFIDMLNAIYQRKQ